MFTCTFVITGTGTWATVYVWFVHVFFYPKFQGTSAEPTKKRTRPSTKKSRGTILYAM